MSAAASQPVLEESFGRRLRRERERRQIAIASIADNTKISAALFDDLERDDPSRWPSGIFRRSFIKAYAQAIGLDGDATAREFLERFPDPNDPNALISPELTAPPAAASGAHTATLRLTLAPESGAFTRERLLRSVRDRVAAIACDMAVVSIIGLAMYAVLGSFWMPLCVALAGYYAGGVLLLGNTPGVCLCAPGDRTRGASLSTFFSLLERARKGLRHSRPSRLREVVGVQRKRTAHHTRIQPELVERAHDGFDAAQLIRPHRPAENA